MKQIASQIYIGTDKDVPYLPNKSNWSLVNTANNYHYNMLQWKRGVDYKEDQHYLLYQKDHMLSVNWVDGPASLFNWKGEGVRIFKHILSFIENERVSGRNILIFCNQGLSRSPTVGLVYLAKHLRSIPSEDFRVAKEAFLEVYPLYMPKGIADFVSEHWEEL